MKSVRFNPKRAALICAASVFLTLVFTYNLIIGSGLIPGADTAVDARTQKLEDIAYRKATVEGQFVDCTGAAISVATEPGKPAQLLYGEAYSHLIGYNSNTYGTSGLRNRLYQHLFYGGADNRGAQVTLTTDNGLQQYCYDLLEGMEGSIIVMNADSGALLACASRSSAEVGYNVNEIDTYFADYDSREAFFLNRATMAEHTAGSTFKILTTAAMIENGMEDYVYDDLDGTFTVGNTVIHNYRNKVFGPALKLETALKESANVYFASAGVELGAMTLQNMAYRFQYGKTVDLDFATLTSTFDLGNLDDRALLAQTAYGQGEVAVSPMQIAMTMAGVLNDGVMMKPYLIEQITDDDSLVYRAEQEKVADVLSGDVAQKVKHYLHETAQYYGFTEELYGTVYAKTGTSDQGHDGLNHIYYLMGADLPGGRYVILVNRSNTVQTSGTLKRAASDVLLYLSSM